MPSAAGATAASHARRGSKDGRKGSKDRQDPAHLRRGLQEKQDSEKLAVHGAVGDIASRQGLAKTTTKTTKRLCEIDKEIRKSSGKDDTGPKIPWIRTERADMIFGTIIITNALFMGVDAEWGANAGFGSIFWFTESIFLILFGVEITLRLKAESPRYRNYFDTWGIFDMMVTILGCIDTWVFTPIYSSGAGSLSNPMSNFAPLRVLRLIRLVRLIRILRMFSELVILLRTIVNSMKAVAWMSLLLAIIMYTGSVITVLLLGQPYAKDNEDVNRFFGSLGTALFSHFCVVTLEGWPDIAAAAMSTNRLWGIYFICTIVLTNFCLVNLMVGVIVERIINFSAEQEGALESFVAESEQFHATLKTLFDSADLDRSGDITRAEVRSLLQDQRTHDILHAVGINPHIPSRTLYTIMDLNHDGPTSFDEFFGSLMRLCGSKNNIHSVFVQGDIAECEQNLSRRLTAIDEHVRRLGAVTAAGMRPGSMPPAVSLQPQPKPLALQPSRDNGNGPVHSQPAASGSAAADASSQAQGLAASPPKEGSIMQLLDRMDRFSQAQQLMFAEMHALREIAGGRRAVQVPCDVLTACVPARSQWRNLGPAVVSRAGREINSCCVDIVPGIDQQSVNRGGIDRRQDAVPDQHLRNKVRKDLEAEFRSKQGTGMPPQR